jgi:hypothetical protein
MQSRHERLSFDSKEWVCVSVLSPLGAVMIARRLPAIARRGARVANGASNGATRRFDLSNHQGSAMKRVRSRR